MEEIEKRTHAEPYMNQGRSYAKNGQCKEAISSFTKAIEINPGYDEAYDKRGLCYLMTGQYKKVCPDLKRACELGLCESYEGLKSLGICK